jgi:hypothetical protein
MAAEAISSPTINETTDLVPAHGGLSHRLQNLHEDLNGKASGQTPWLDILGYYHLYKEEEEAPSFPSKTTWFISTHLTGPKVWLILDLKKSCDYRSLGLPCSYLPASHHRASRGTYISMDLAPRSCMDQAP